MYLTFRWTAHQWEKKYGRVYGKLTNTHILSNNLVRVPLWLGLEDRLEEVIRYVIAAED
jgi:hypothetical protein